jgi:hypothetical protein
MNQRLMFLLMLLLCELRSGFATANDNPDWNDLFRRAQLEYGQGHLAAAGPLFVGALQSISSVNNEERAAVCLTHAVRRAIIAYSSCHALSWSLMP